MAKCLGENPPYGCAHHLEHQEAARKGWITRRHGVQFAGTKQHEALSALFGEEITHAHTAPEHRGLVRFKNKGKWYELPRAEFNRLAREGETHIREQGRASKKAEQEDAKTRQREEREEREYQREVAKVEQEIEREKRKEDRRKLIEQREVERGRIGEERSRQAQEGQLAAARKAEYQSVTKRIRQMGGIKPYRKSATTGKTPELEEWKGLPQAVKTRNERQGFALDDMAQAVNEEYPWLHIETGSDLQQYLIDKKNQKIGPMARAWYGSPEQQEKSAQAQKPMQPEKNIPKEETPAKPAAPKPEQDTFDLIVTQKANGKWIVSRRYKSGKIVQLPGEHDKNPLNKNEKAAKPREAPRGQADLFGPSQTRSIFDEE